MEDLYQDETYYPPEPQRGVSGWLIALLVVVVLLIVCCMCVFVALLLLGPAVGTTFSTIIETLEATTPMP